VVSPPTLGTAGSLRAGASVVTFSMDMDEKGFRTELYLDYLEERYRREDNPVYAWMAYDLSRKEEVDFPEWVLNYLGEVAEDLIALAEGREPKRKPKREPSKKPKKKTKGQRVEPKASEKIYAILKLGKPNSRNAFTRYQDSCRKETVLGRVLEEMLREEKETISRRIAEKVAKEMAVSVESVNQWYYEWERTYNPPTPERMIRRMKLTKERRRKK
jgi:hypothetical protein